ncbi:MAG: hypothetical protein R3338_08000 [Thermoanaerobaculia bacterium]|nr:hypothetical protein [Thermoanaerobaculia bacterium]
MIWRERKWILVGLGILLLVNAIFFVTYRVRYESRIEGLEKDLAIAQEELKTATEKRRDAERILSSVDQTREDLSRVYDDWWSTRPERLAPMIVELQSLAEESGLNPPARSYNWTAERSTDDVGAQVLNVTFRVEGTYREIRNLINLIELSPHFVIIEQIGLADTSDGGDNLSMTLTLKTLFRSDEEPEQTSA